MTHRASAFGRRLWSRHGTVSIRALLLVLVGSLAGALLVGPVTAAGKRLDGNASVRNAREVTAVRTVSAAGIVSTNSPFQWVDVPGMSHTVGVPAGQRARLVITFSAPVNCVDAAGGAANECYIRVLVDGLATAAPAEVLFARADTAGSWDANSMQFVSEALPAGVHTVKVQFLHIEANASMNLDARTLTVLRAYVPA
ncbi:MAG: hypothetical protein M3452_09245 [Chloroflexota bacterium]|nr:hypothetical protein [Chloroflexota bacterium]